MQEGNADRAHGLAAYLGVKKSGILFESPSITPMPTSATPSNTESAYSLERQEVFGFCITTQEVENVLSTLEANHFPVGAVSVSFGTTNGASARHARLTLQERRTWLLGAIAGMCVGTLLAALSVDGLYERSFEKVVVFSICVIAGAAAGAILGSATPQSHQTLAAAGLRAKQGGGNDILISVLCPSKQRTQLAQDLLERCGATDISIVPRLTGRSSNRLFHLTVSLLQMLL